MKIASIDTVFAEGSTGKLVEFIHQALLKHGHQSRVYYGRGTKSDDISAIKISNTVEVHLDAALSRVSGQLGVFSPFATSRLIDDLEKFQPDVMHLHELHGYYANFIPLIDYLKARQIPIVWTLHCEFAYTGRCGYAFDCDQWKTACKKCPDLSTYPSSWFFDNCEPQFEAKKKTYSDLKKACFVSVSNWLNNRVQQSFLKNSDSKVIYNGIDTSEVFLPTSSYADLVSLHQLEGRYVVLSVAPDLMSERKGGQSILEIARRLQEEPITFLAVGVTGRVSDCPPNVILLAPILDPKELARYYALADLFLLTSQRETFSLTCAESLACGTPIVGYDSGGPVEVAPEPYGYFVPVGDVDGLTSLVSEAYRKKLQLAKSDDCTAYARSHYSKERMFNDYLRLYQDMAEKYPRGNRDVVKPIEGLFGAGEHGYQICRNCIMDTSDPNIKFDDRGWCDYCNNFEQSISPHWYAGSAAHERLMTMAETIKRGGERQEFDCIIGLSGGLDSSYTAYVAKEKMGLRPLLVHVDAGWNTDQAVGNIEKLVDGLGLELYTEVINWQEMKDLQVAFLRAGIPDQDLPQDAAFFSGLYKFAREHNIKHVMTGSNYSTECCREPEEWGGYLGIDKTLFSDIHRQFGKIPLDSFPLTDILVYKIWYQRILGMTVHHPLNLVPFVKKDAEDELESRFGWKRFQHKHHESRFTRFYEDYWLPRRFGFEKRRAHFSSLIMTGQMTRQAALERTAHPEMDEHFLKQEFEFVAHKLDLTVDELQRLFDLPKRTYANYKNKRRLIGIGAATMRLFGAETRFFR
jgi:N-acetyl sugar amidotransferase